MAEYVLVYHDDNTRMPSNPESEEAAAHMAKYREWMTGLGAALVNPGTPFGPSKIVSVGGVADREGSHRISGFSTVEADSMDAALEMAKACPYLDFGDIEVAEVMKMG